MTITKEMTKEYITENRTRNAFEMSAAELENYCNVLSLYCEDCETRAAYEPENLLEALHGFMDSYHNEDEEDRADALNDFTAYALDDDLDISEELFRDTEKVLYFDGAGFEDADISRATVGNCRIRSAFSLDDGRRVYLELIATQRSEKEKRSAVKWEYTGFVDSCHFITDDEENDDCNRHPFPRESLPASFEYSFNGILELVNSLGASFDRIEVLNTLGGYRVFSDCSGSGVNAYNYGDEFKSNADLIAHREQIRDYIQAQELKRGEKSPCFSLWVDSEEPAALHFLNYRRDGFGACLGSNYVFYCGIPSDVSRLPWLERVNAVEGAYYRFPEGVAFVKSLYSISEEFAAANDLYLLDRVDLSIGDSFALPGSRVRQ